MPAALWTMEGDGDMSTASGQLAEHKTAAAAAESDGAEAPAACKGASDLSGCWHLGPEDTCEQLARRARVRGGGGRGGG